MIFIDFSTKIEKTAVRTAVFLEYRKPYDAFFTRPSAHD